MEILNRKIIKQKTVVEQVMEEMKQLISSGRFKVNDKIPPENELAEMFGVSRPTIREAVKIFNYLGILESRTGSGTYISPRENISREALTWSILLGAHDLNELIEFRLIIEERSLLKLTSAYKKNPAGVGDYIAALEAEVTRMSGCIELFSREILAQADYAFHAVVISGSVNSLFSSLYETLESFMHEEISRTQKKAKNVASIVSQHRAILDGIKSGNTEQAVKAFREHLGSSGWKIFEKMPEILEI